MASMSKAEFRRLHPDYVEPKDRPGYVEGRPDFVLGFGDEAWPNAGGPPTRCKWSPFGYTALIAGQWQPINAIAFRD